MRLELTRAGDYAIRAMLAMAEPNAPRWLSVSRISASMNVPPRFLPRVMRDLVAAGLAEAHAGRSGGYCLARPATEITILDIVLAIEPDDAGAQCVLRGIPCGSSGFCLVHATFADARTALKAGLAASTLAAVMHPHDSRRGQLARTNRAGWPIALPEEDGED